MSTALVTDLTAGTWNIDPAHSSVSFVARHLGLSKVRGSFTGFEGTIVVAENHLDSKVSVTIDATTVVTGDEKRDAHLRSSDFFDTDTHKQITFESTSVEEDGDDFKVHGTLTIHGTTKPVTLDLEFLGVSADPWGGTRAGFSASTQVSRKEFGVEFDIPLDGGGLVVGDRIRIELDVEAVKAA
jgi:polyisoprenoid-binding protein YceI